MPSRARAAISGEEARRLDANAEELGLGVERLMANAGKALAADIRRRVGKRDAILLLCGHGNNGGDGLAAAVEMLRTGHDARVVLARPATAMMGPGRAWLERIPKERLAVWKGKPEPAWSNVGLVVDCLLGSGLNGKPRAPYAAIIGWVNRRRGKTTILSCDVPSGLGSALAVRPDATLTLHAPKLGMDAKNSGRITVAPIGIPPRAVDIGIGDLRMGYPIPDAASHKGDNGRVVVAAGSTPYLGAPLYCALGAYRTGADLVHVLTPSSVAFHLRSLSPEPIVHEAGGEELAAFATIVARPLLDRGAALLVGPGLGPGRTARAAAQALLRLAIATKAPVVVDADGLLALDDAAMRRLAGRLVVTPHAGEFTRRFGKAATPANVHAVAAEHGITILCKGVRAGPGHADAVSDGTTLRLGRRGHPTMTVGGTGDVLAGSVAALLAKGATPFSAACAAAYLVGVAGEEAALHASFGASPIDVAESIPQVLLRL